MLTCIGEITQDAGKIVLAGAPSRAEPGLRPRREVMAFDFPGLRKAPAAADVSLVPALGDPAATVAIRLQGCRSGRRQVVSGFARVRGFVRQCGDAAASAVAPSWARWLLARAAIGAADVEDAAV